MTTFTSLITAISSSIFLGLGFYIFFSWKKRNDFFLKIFTTFLLSIGLQQLLFSFGSGPFSDNPQISNIFWWFAHVFMFIGVGSLLLLPIKIKFPSKERVAIKALVTYSVVGSIILLMNLSEVESFMITDNIFNWSVPPLSGAVIGLFAGVISIFSAYIFISESFKIEDRIIKWRSLMLGFGILVFFIGGPLHNFIETPIMQIIASSLLIFGSFLMFLGILLPKIMGRD